MLKLLLHFYRESWPLVTAAVVGGLFSGISGASLVALIGRAIDKREAPVTLVAAFIGLCLLHVVCKVGSELALLHVVQSFVLKLRITLSRKLLATPLKRLQSLGNARLLAILTEDLTTLAHCSQQLPLLFGNAMVVLACLGYLAWLSWPVFVGLVGMLVVGAAYFIFAQRGPARHLSAAREQTDVLFRDLRSLVEGTKELQLSSHRSSHFINRVLEPGANKLRRTFVRGMTGYAWIANLGSMQFFIALGLLVFGVPYWMPEHSSAVPVVALVLLYIAEPVSALLTALPTLQQAAIALRKAQMLGSSLDDPSRPEASGAAAPFGHEARALKLENVRHSHQDGERGFSVGPLNMEIPPGKISYIVGPNGSGKTTLALLLLGLYVPDEGRIALNGVAVTPDNLVHYRNEFTAVFADFHLFDQLLAPMNDGVAEQARRYLRRLEIAHKVSVDDGRFSTLALSTGQRKRLALLAAYLEDRPIYLFDEWASDQDPVFKKLFYTELLPDLRARGKTVIVITHDFQYFDHADHLIELVEGHRA